MSLAATQPTNSPFKESDWDRRLDDMLEDLGGSGAPSAVVPMPTNGVRSHQQQFSSSSSMQQSYSYSSSSQQQHQVRMQSSSSSHQQNLLTNGARSTNNFSVAKSASAASLKDSADGVLKDLETGLKQSTNYIQESHRRWEGPGGSQEWHEVRRGGDPDYNLEQQVQHMIGNVDTETTNYQQQQQQQNQNYAAANHLTTYKVQTNQYSGTGERILPGEEEDRPASRLKQNIDDLDTLLYDLNNARHLSPESGGQDYDDTAGGEGHVKRTVQAFNEFSQQQCEVVSNKPPSPSPRRQKTQGSPVPPRHGRQGQAQCESYQRYQATSTSSTTEDNTQAGNFSHSISPPPEQPSYYTKFNSSKPSSPSSPLPTSVSFPNHQPRSPTPQMPPKRVEELMSEFHEFDNVHSGNSPTPPMFSPSQKTQQTLEIAELPDGPSVREASPPPPRSVNQAGPEVYYPPGAEFTRSVQATHPVGDGGSLSLQGPARRERRERGERLGEGGDKQGAAVIPICLPLCCAAPCVIM